MPHRFKNFTAMKSHPNKMEIEVPLPLCEHAEPLRLTRKYEARCPVCRSFWDLNAINSGLVYDHAYPEQRSHFDPFVGENKTRSLHSWLSRIKIDLKMLRVCEVGFGGGFCLRHLHERSAGAFGIEVISENIENSVRLGVSRDSLFMAESLPAVMPLKVDLWIFQDSFEHLPEPAGFMEWVVQNSSKESRILLVAPDANSLSARILGRFWPHRVPDHRFHWSRIGLIEFFSRRGFSVERSFNPIKHVSLNTLFRHLVYMSSSQISKKWERVWSRLNLVLKFNIGEMGLLLFRARSDEC